MKEMFDGKNSGQLKVKGKSIKKERNNKKWTQKE
jgi:hypothetical protein